MPSIFTSSPEDDKYGVGDEEHVKSRSKPFRFKSVPSKVRSRQRNARSCSPNRRHTRKQHHRRRSGDSQRHAPNLDSETAFRESLFDALGDDEGAAFWEGVYGQPIHGYSNMHQNEKTGDLERMTDDEYVAFVRRKMWEKSREGVDAMRQERRAQQRETEGAKERIARDKKSYYIPRGRQSFDEHIDASLKRNQERMVRRHWQEKWQTYLESWSKLNALSDCANDNALTTARRKMFLRDKITWPVASGRWDDVDEQQVELFMKNCASQSEAGSQDEQSHLHTLKTERIRWHPDKIQQKYGAMNIDDDTKRGVTMVFQILDKLWNQAKMSA